MVKVVISNGTCIHSGTVCAGSVAGTVDVGSNSFVSIVSSLIMVQNGHLLVPSHNNPPCVPPNIQSHSFTPNSFGQSYVTINGNKICLVGDSYTSDATAINGAGSNTFVDVS